VHGADPVSGIAFSYITSTLDLSEHDVRSSSLLFAAASCLTGGHTPTSSED